MAYRPKTYGKNDKDEDTSQKTLNDKCCSLQIRPVEEQLKQWVIGERHCISRKRKSYKVLYFDLLTRPKMPLKVMHRKEVTHSNGSYERKSRGRKLADEMGRAKKMPMVHYRVMHRKRVTSELHDSYFLLMMIKHSISKIEWASNDYIIQLTSTSQCSYR